MFSKSANHNPNYLCSIVKIEQLRKHNNADRLQVAAIYSNSVICSINAKVGDLVCYFPLECKISADFLAFTNCFDQPELNADKKTKGFFSHKCRVRCMKLRGEKSEGYMVPVSQLEEFAKAVLGKKIKITESDVGTDFDELCGKLFVEKYLLPIKQIQGPSKKTKGSLKKHVSKLVENQFRLHVDTHQLKRNIGKINPNDYISITGKLHGTSFVTSRVLVKRKLKLKERIAKFFGVKVQETEYGPLYSSRCVIKNRNFIPNDNGGFYKEDLWKLVTDKIYPFLKDGESVYGEMVGYTPSGKFIQKDYDYGCAPGEFDFYIYRVTQTSVSGHVYEFSHKQAEEFCKRNGFKMVPEYFYGKAKDLFKEMETVSYETEEDLINWREIFLNKLIEKYLEKDCTICKSNVPDEGVVVRKDIHDYEAYKLKSFKFLGRESELLDKGEVDIESEQSVANENN